MDKPKMPIDNLNFIQKFIEDGAMGYLWFVVLSIWAGAVRYIQKLDGNKPTLWGFVGEMIISGFVGIVTAMFCQYYQLDYMLTAVIVAVSAHNGTESLKYLIKKNLRCQQSEETIKSQPIYAKKELKNGSSD